MAASTDENLLTDEEKGARLSSVTMVLNPRMKYPTILDRARHAWFNATGEDAPAIISGDHALGRAFVDRILGLKDAMDYDEILATVSTIKEDIHSHLQGSNETSSISVDSGPEITKRRVSMLGIQDVLDGEQLKKLRMVDDEPKPTMRWYEWNEPVDLVKPSSSIAFAVQDFLDEFEEAIQGEKGMLHTTAVAQEYFPPGSCWKPDPASTSWTESQCESLSKLRIPAVPLHTPPHPDLLLYLLGRLVELDPSTKDRVNALQDTPMECLLNNSPGSGKTRLLLEFSCKKWTFYFMLAWHPSTNPYGSRDFDIASQMIIDPARVGPDGSPFMSIVVEPQGPATQDDVNRWFSTWGNNTAIVSHVYRLVLLARLLIYQRFRKLVKGHAEEAAMRAWCLLQVCPVLSGMLVSDVFSSLVSLLAPLSSESAQHQIQRIIKELEGELPYCLIFDEAQSAAQRWPTAFGSSLDVRITSVLVTSQPSTAPALSTYCRPLLKPLINTFRNEIIDHNIRTFISGTKVHQELVNEALSSLSAKPAAFWNYMQFGAQESPKQMRDLLEQFFGKRVLSYVQSDMWQEIYYWLQGRHRFIMVFISGILMTGPKPEQIMNVLSNILMVLTGHPLIGNKHQRLDYIKLDTLVPKVVRNPGEYSDGLRRLMENSLLEFIVSGNTLKFDSDRLDVVAVGIGRFIVGRPADQKVAVIVNEPLVLAALFYWLRGDGRTNSPLRLWLDTNMARANAGARGIGFEDVSAYLFWDWFGDHGRPLNEIFQFISPEPEWASQNARLISVFRSNDSEGITRVVSKRHTGEFCYGAVTAEDALGWFRGHADRKSPISRAPMLRPHNHFGPDIIFGLLLDSGEEILVCVQCKFYSDVLGDDLLRSAIWKLSPEGFFSGKVPKGMKDDFEAALDMFDNATGTLPFPKPQSGRQSRPYRYDKYPPKYRILRVLAAFSDTVNIPADFKTEAVGSYPLAVLSPEAMALGGDHFSAFKRAFKKAQDKERAVEEKRVERAAADDAARVAQNKEAAESEMRRSGRLRK